MKQWMIPGVLVFVFVLSLSGLLAGTAWLDQPRAASEEPRTPVIVELFTSEGCSSCPPADELLIMLDEQQPVAGALVIPLSEHVDYWNGLGWPDPFASTVFTQRQEQYARALPTRGLYTPQMVVDGRMEFVGSRRDTAREAIARAAAAPKAAVSLAIIGDGRSPVVIEVTISGVSRLGDPDVADLWLAITERGLTTDVRRGENARRRLRHTAVVRQLERIGTLPTPIPARFSNEAEVALERDWQVANLRAVVFLQERESRRVLGAAQAWLD